MSKHLSSLQNYAASVLHVSLNTGHQIPGILFRYSCEITQLQPHTVHNGPLLPALSSMQTMGPISPPQQVNASTLQLGRCVDELNAAHGMQGNPTPRLEGKGDNERDEE